jgi:hypothetical protein
MPVLTAAELNRATLARQLLLRRAPCDVAEGVRRLVAVQAQEPASPYIGLWSRLSDFDPTELDAAFADRAVVKATLARITLHVVHVDDHRPFREALEPTLRASRLTSRFTAAAQLDPGDVGQLVADLVAHADRPRTAVELRTWLEARLGVPSKGAVWRTMRAYPPLVHAPTGPPWAFGRRSSFVAAPAAPALDAGSVDAALRVLIRRYLEGFGPASLADIAQFALVQQARLRPAVRAMGDELEQLEGPDGVRLLDVPGAPRPPGDVPAPCRLLPMWDSTLLAYADRSRIIPAPYRRRAMRSNGDVLPTLLVDGHVAGVWRPVDGGIEASAFHRLPATAWDALAVEAAGLVAFLADREPQPYGRYDRWWDRLSAVQARVLPG